MDWLLMLETKKPQPMPAALAEDDALRIAYQTHFVFNITTALALAHRLA